MRIFENYAISRYKSNLVYYLLTAGISFVIVHMLFYNVIAVVYESVSQLHEQVNLLAQLDDDAIVEPEEDAGEVEFQIKNPKKAHRYSTIFDLKETNDRVHFSWCYVFARWMFAPICGSYGNPSEDLPDDPSSRKSALFAKYLEFINEEIHDEKDRIDQLRSYEVIARHLSHEKLSDHGKLYEEVFRYFSTISWDPSDKNSRDRLRLIEAATTEVALVRQRIGISVLASLK